MTEELDRLDETEEEPSDLALDVAAGRFLDDVHAEIRRARDLYPREEVDLSAASWLSVLTEEVGEVARVVNECMLSRLEPREAERRIRRELVQVAAMAGRFHNASLGDRAGWIGT